MELGLGKRTALVTGSYRGTGAAIARVLADEGATVVVHGLVPGQAEPVVEEIRSAGGKALGATGDVRSDDGARAVAEAALAAAGRVDVLVNNYGAAEGGGWLDGTDDDWLDMFQTNVMSGARMVRHLVPGMKARGFGRVLFVGTVGSVRPRARMPGYYASKASLANMTVSLCKELANTGITVNTISPGILATAEVRAGLERRAAKHGWGGDWQEIERRAVSELMPNPSGRLGRIEEVGQLVAFLASDHGGYINGSDLRIDGGAADCV
jgi:NAD(P)-dependent dehydrogenase (short-subunit alcohol dehydrogenase family)